MHAFKINLLKSLSKITILMNIDIPSQALFEKTEKTYGSGLLTLNSHIIIIYKLSFRNFAKY